MIRRRGAKYQAIVKFRGQQVAVKTFDTEREAKAWHDVEAARYRSSKFSSTLGKTHLSVVLVLFLRFRETQLTENGLATDRVVVGMLPDWLTNRKVGSIGSKDLQLIVDGWQETRKVSTVVRYCDVLKAITAFCVKHGYMAADPMEDVDVPKRRKTPREMRPFNETELHAVVKEVGGFYGDVLLVIGFSGLRMGEARALRVGDVALDGLYPHFNIIRSQSEGKSEKATKSERHRTVPIDPQIEGIVKAYMKGRKRTAYLLSRDGTTQLWRSRIVQATKWDIIGDGRTFHDLRHAAAVNWLRRGIPANTVQAWLGHRDLEATNIYTSYLGMDIDPGSYEKLG